MSQKVAPPVDKLAKTPTNTESFTEEETKNPTVNEGLPPEEPPKEKKKPTVAVINEYGKTERRRRAIDLGISEKLLPPLTRKSVATYRLVTSWDVTLPDRLQKVGNVIDPATHQVPDPQNLSMPGTYTFYDPFEADPTKRVKTMFNYGRHDIAENKEGDKFLKREIVDVEFINDIKRVDCEREYLLYLFMERHPLNGSNRYRQNKSIQPLFIRTDITTAKTEEFRVVELDLSFEAERAVRDVTNKDKIIGLAVATGSVPVHNRMIEAVKADLRMWARNHPREFFKMHGDVTPGIKLTILDAQGLGLIDYNPDTRTYLSAETNEDLHSVLIGDDPLESFTKHLKKNDSDYQKVKELLDHWEV